ncbi:hypothetical protein CTAYLR_006365 [Chrysophaeum taylorii]|uniref:EGF-like domain-containing protein n=1 Tax=Chrysophaeum taylorii TaxID=2483200 RepID=A0AAD7U6Q3_9STRA|nr:hypothetical protein CTAYLR_006365 [Chrysophaeum taylorii]
MGGRLVRFAALLVVARAACPNHCSGHGDCGNENVCECDDLWTSYPDCSGRLCPNATAWVDKPYAKNRAHAQLECAGVGACNRDDGTCVCPSGFTGEACQRLDCTASCNDNGKCITLYNLGHEYGPDTAPGDPYGGDGMGVEYANWESEVIMSCFCDWGVTGPECDIRMCPRGFDPLDGAGYYRTINITTNVTDAQSQLNGTFSITFDGLSFSFNANASEWTGDACASAWESLDNVASVQCSRLASTADKGGTWVVQFLAWPHYPIQNNIFHHDGNPPLSSFTCDVSQAVAHPNGRPTCSIADEIADNVKDYLYCSGRGTCDFSTGQCSCYTNFEGVACSNSVAAVSDDDVDILLLHATEASFDNSMLRMKAERERSSDFNFIKASAGGQDVEIFRIEGNGDTTFTYGDFTLSSGLMTLNNGLRLTSGNIQIDSGNLILVSGNAYLNLGNLAVTGNSKFEGDIEATNGTFIFSSNVSLSNVMTVRATFDNFQSTVLYVEADRNASSAYKLLEIANYEDGVRDTVFSVTGTPRTFVNKGGLEVVGGAVVRSNGLVIDAGGLLVNAGGATISSTGLTITTGDITMSNGDITVAAGSITASAGTLTVAGVESSASITVSAGSITASAGTLTVAGVESSASITVSAGSITASAGTLTVAGVTTSASITISSGSITASTGTLTVAGVTKHCWVDGRRRCGSSAHHKYWFNNCERWDSHCCWHHKHCGRHGDEYALRGRNSKYRCVDGSQCRGGCAYHEHWVDHRECGYSHGRWNHEHCRSDGDQHTLRIRYSKHRGIDGSGCC